MKDTSELGDLLGLKTVVVDSNDEETIQAVGKLRALAYSKKGLMQKDSDLDIFDRQTNTLLFAAKTMEGRVVGTLRIVGARDEHPKLPIDQYSFNYFGETFTFRELLKLDQLKELRGINFEVSRYAIHPSYHVNTKKCGLISIPLFDECYKGAVEHSIPEAVICARPIQTKGYEGFGGRVLLPGLSFTSSDGLGAGLHPADIMGIRLDDLAKWAAQLGN